MSIIVSFIGAGLFKKINVYDAFIEGAKEGFATAVRIIPYLVAILVAVGVFRASGAMDICRRWHKMDAATIQNRHHLCRRAANRYDETTVGKRCTWTYAGDHAPLRRRFIRRQAKLHISRVHRYHILYIGSLFWQHWCTIHTPCSGLRTIGRPRWCACRNRNMLHFLLNEHKTKWQI